MWLYIGLVGCRIKVKLDTGCGVTKILMVGYRVKILRKECDLLILMGRMHDSFKIDIGCKITGYGRYVENCDSNQAGSGESFSL